MEPADGTLRTMRRVLLGALLAGMAGTTAELLLIGHVEDEWQFVPIVLLALGLVIAAAHAFRPGELTTRLLQLLMVLFIASGGIGMVLHYRGNTEFALEMHPALSGVALVKETLTGAFPVLAPGTMTLLGIIGLVQTYRHRP
jgi:hypothetical protein